MTSSPLTGRVIVHLDSSRQTEDGRLSMMQTVFDAWDEQCVPLAHRSMFYRDNVDNEDAYRNENQRLQALARNTPPLGAPNKQLEEALLALAKERKSLANGLGTFSDAARLQIMKEWNISESAKNRKMLIVQQLWRKDTLTLPGGALRSSKLANSIGAAGPTFMDNMRISAANLAQLAEERLKEQRNKLQQGRQFSFAPGSVGPLLPSSTAPQQSISFGHMHSAHTPPTSIFRENSGSSPGGQSETASRGPPCTTPRRGKLKHTFKGNDRDRISVSAGDLVHVLAEVEDWMDVLTFDGCHRGLVPTSYVVIDTDRLDRNSGASSVSAGSFNTAKPGPVMKQELPLPDKPEPLPLEQELPSYEQVLPAAQQIPSAAKQVPRPAQQVLPPAQQVPPPAQQVSPPAQQVPLLAQQVSPPAQQVPPLAQQVSPPAQQVPPPAQQVPLPTQPSLTYARVIHNFVAEHDDELSVQVNDVVTMGPVEEGWCMMVRMDGASGLVPASYVLRRE